eukprot:6662964-Pyramimonas_sp.AAC.1
MGAASDSPSNADLYELDLRAGDVMVLGSDGLLDNCFPDEIANLVSEHKGRPAGEIAEALMR